MITKIVAIKNLARLTSYSARGDLTLRHTNLIYGQNGQGKTTLTAIFRSLSTGDCSPLFERCTLGQTGVASVEAMIDDKRHTFDGTRWSRKCGEMMIYDSTFVSENIHTGDVVDQKHRRNLYELAVGKVSVTTARRIGEIDGQTRSLSEQISRAKGVISERMHGPFSLSDFLALPPKEPGQVGSEIARLEALLAASRDDAAISARRSLDHLTIPTLVDGMEKAMSVDFSSLSELAASELASHLERLGSGGERWIREGVGMVREDRCPFCATDLRSNALVESFRSYFSEKYSRHISELEAIKSSVDSAFSEGSVGQLDETIAANSERVREWKDLVDLSAVVQPTVSISRVLARARAVQTGLVTTKLASPGSAVNLPLEYREIERELATVTEASRRYNALIDDANAKIAATKQKCTAANPMEIEASIRHLKNTIVRHEPAVAKMCTGLEDLQKEYEALGEEKETLKKALSSNTAGVLLKYETAINCILERAGVNFRITGSRTAYPGGKAASVYKIQINGCEVDAVAPAGHPSLRTLSAGDKSTLALAFFLAQLKLDPEVGQKCVVIDDPVSSLDAFRINCTRHLIAELAAKVGQLIVLSHDAAFLHDLYDLCDRATTKCLQLKPDGNTVQLAEWDPVEANQSRHRRDAFILTRYARGEAATDHLSIARSIRPFLEGALRIRFPEDFGDGEWLGGFIEKIRESGDDGRLAHMKPDLANLEMVNDYSKDGHHEGIAAPSVIDEQQLRCHVRWALRLAQGGPYHEEPRQ